MPYTGRLYIAEIDDRRLPNRWFKTWGHMEREYTRSAKDCETIEKLAADIARRGQRTPIHLGVNYRGEEVTYDAGNHRFLALKRLGRETITFNWYDVSRSTRMLDDAFDYDRFGLTNPDN